MSTITPINLARPNGGGVNLAALHAGCVSLNADIANAATLSSAPDLSAQNLEPALDSVYDSIAAINAELAEPVSPLTQPVLNTVGFTGYFSALYDQQVEIKAVIDALNTTTEITVNWTDTSALEDGFRIETSTDGVSYSTAGTVAANVETYTITGLAFNTLYYIRVYAYNGGGDSSVLGPVQVYTQPSLNVSSVSASVLSSESVRISFTEPATLPQTGYRVYGRLTGVGSYTALGNTLAGNSSVDITGLSPSEEYQFYVVAYNENGSQADAETAASSIVTATTLPAILTASIDTTGLILSVTFSEAMTEGTGGDGGFSLSSNLGTALSISSYASGDGTATRVFNLSRVVEKDPYEVIDLDYSDPGDGLENGSGVDLDTATGFEVVNNSVIRNYVEERFEEVDSGGALGSATDGFDSDLISTVELGTGGTFEPDDTTATIINGSRQLKVERVSGDCYGVWTLPEEVDDLWVHVSRVSVSPSTNRNFLVAKTAGGSDVFAVYLNGSFRWSIDGVTSGSTTAPGGTAPNHFWIHQVRNGTVTLYVSDNTGIKPASGTLVATATARDFAISEIWLGAFNDNSVRYYDDLIVQASEIGDNP